jgi:hypothetical protein
MGRRKNKPMRGTITPSTAFLYSVLTLAIILASITTFSYFGKLYMQEKLSIDNVILLHRGVIEACSNSYGSIQLEIFIPPNSRVLFDNNGITLEGVDIKPAEAIGIKILLSIFSSEPLSFDVSSYENTIQIKYFVELSKKEKPRAITFEKRVIPGGLWSITLVCRNFDNVTIVVSSSG